VDSTAYVTRTYSRLVEVATRHSHVSPRPGYAVVTRRTTDVSPYRTIGTASIKPHLEATGPEGGRPSGGGGGGGWPRRALELGAPNTSGVRSCGGSPGTAAPGRARGTQGKREKGESVWAGPRSGAQL
jgi:hypothetical protein